LFMFCPRFPEYNISAKSQPAMLSVIASGH
jgi:hypothetical protein